MPQRIRQLTAEDQKRIDAAFSGFDIGEENESIDPDEMLTALHKIDPQANEDEIRLLIDTIDADGNGEVSREEFKQFLERKILGQIDDDEMFHKFEATFDKNLSGLVTPHDLRQMLIREGEHPLSDAEANEFVELAETVGGEKCSNGLIEYRAFLKWLKEAPHS